jgi:hypothetical protein
MDSAHSRWISIMLLIQRTLGKNNIFSIYSIANEKKLATGKNAKSNSVSLFNFFDREVFRVFSVPFHKFLFLTKPVKRETK